VLFEAFIEVQAERLVAGDWPGLERLLDQEDDVLLDWIAGRNMPPDPTMVELVKSIKHARQGPGKTENRQPAGFFSARVRAVRVGAGSRDRQPLAGMVSRDRRRDFCRCLVGAYIRFF